MQCLMTQFSPMQLSIVHTCAARRSGTCQFARPHRGSTGGMGLSLRRRRLERKQAPEANLVHIQHVYSEGLS